MTISEILTQARAEIAALTINPLAITISGSTAKVDHAQKLLVEDALAILDKMAAQIGQGGKSPNQRNIEAAQSARETMESFQAMTRMLANVCARQLGAASNVYGDDWPKAAKEIWLALNGISGGTVLSPKEVESRIVEGKIAALRSFGCSPEDAGRGIAKYERELLESYEQN